MLLDKDEGACVIIAKYSFCKETPGELSGVVQHATLYVVIPGSPSMVV